MARKTIPEGHSVQKKTGWDKDKTTFRLTLDLTAEQKELIDDAALEDLLYVREWIIKQSVKAAKRTLKTKR